MKTKNKPPEKLGSNLKRGTFYTTKNGRVGRITVSTDFSDAFRKSFGSRNSSIDTTGYSSGKKNFEYQESTPIKLTKETVGRERVLPIIENLKKGATKKVNFKKGGIKRVTKKY